LHCLLVLWVSLLNWEILSFDLWLFVLCFIIEYFIDVEIIFALSEAIMCVFMQLMLFMESIRFELEKLGFKLILRVTCRV
jgi:hypothetical protein